MLDCKLRQIDGMAARRITRVAYGNGLHHSGTPSSAKTCKARQGMVRDMKVVVQSKSHAKNVSITRKECLAEVGIQYLPTH